MQCFLITSYLTTRPGPDHHRSRPPLPQGTPAAELAAFYSKIAVAYTQIVTIATDGDAHRPSTSGMT
ncbi:MAG TPA: hypothetical protein VGH98_06230, partial [Gemmatimonadaceae bacterium]